jgi:Asp-tRNA(Asn)/Glu-tRNA(Gln) amidotransferase A subunit family amidase
MIAKKQFTPLELLRAACARAESINPKLNAICNVFLEMAEIQIKEGLGDGPFRGVPFMLKDISQQLAGVPLTLGSCAFKDNVPSFDSTLVTRYKRAGLVIFAKTNTPEFGLGPVTESVLFGQTHNPWNLERTPGGSSGGSAAVVASRIVPMAHGSDGGGSIRVPASCCGVFGLKPTRGRVPAGPANLEGWNGVSAYHALTVSVRDSAALLDLSAGVELGAPYWPPPQQRPFLKEVGADPGKLRIALVLKPQTGVPIHPECRTAAMEAGKLCETLGHQVEEVQFPSDFADLEKSRLTIVRVSLARVLEDRARVLGRLLSEKDVEPVAWDFYQMGLRISSVDYSRAIVALHQTGLQMAKFQENYDVILSPVLAKPPVLVGALSNSRSDVEAVYKERAEFMPFTGIYNMTGQPSMSVPLYWTKDGLPIGLMFSARFGDEAVLFRLAAQLEKVRPWASRLPPTAG